MFIDEYLEHKLKSIEKECGDTLHMTSRRTNASDVYLIFGVHQLEYEHRLTRLPSMKKEEFLKVVDKWYDGYKLGKKLEILTGD